MIAVDIRNDATDVRRVLAGYQRGADRVLLRTLNRVIPSVRARAARDVAAELGISQSVARRALNIRNATLGRLTADLGADTKRIPLIAFKARQTRAGVTYQIGKAGRKLLPRAFINVGPKAGRAVLKRVRGDDAIGPGNAFSRGVGEHLVGRYPIFMKYGPSPAGIFIKDWVQKGLDETARERWRIELSAQIKFFLSKQ